MADDRCELLCLDLPKAEALRAARPSEGEARALAEGFRALGDPTRLTLASRYGTAASSASAISPGSPSAPRTSSPTICAHFALPGLPTCGATERWRCTR